MFFQVIFNTLTFVDLNPEMYQQLLSVQSAGIVLLVLCSVNKLNG